MSERYDILQAVITALGLITIGNGYNTTVKYVSSDLNVDHPDQLDKKRFPACFPYDANEVRSPLAIFGSAGDNMQSTLDITIFCMIYSRTASQNTLKRANMIQDIEKAIVTNTALTALLIEQASPTTIITDRGYFKNYSVWDQNFTATYSYIDTTGG